ncbi:MAG TPA: metallophosphoesterase [Blastocatellia bacterium]|nr:metallophosphoesterase [Blastocatellia bacterium]
MSSRLKKRYIIACIVLAGLPLTLYAFFVEPYWIEDTHYRIQAPVTAPLKIAHLSDLHTSGLNRREKELLEILDREKPDLIVITGDSVSTTNGYEGFRVVLRELRAPLGVWVIRGNHENWHPIPDERDFYSSAGVNFLVNESKKPREDFWLVGLDDAFGGSPDLDGALADVPEDEYKIALFHSPGFFNQAAGRCDLALAGHTHGGQVQLPIIGAVWLPPHSGNFVEGWFERNGSRLYVSRGIGTSLLNVRFLCRPEVAFITLEK